jgi:hypothetical protein
MPVTRFGRSVGLPAALRRARQRHSNAMPPSIAASLDPVVDVPVAWASRCACQSSARMFTQRISRSAVCGYSSLSTMFLSKVSAMSAPASGSIHVVTKVARFSRALPSRTSSLRTSWAVTAGGIGPSGRRRRGMTPGVCGSDTSGSSVSFASGSPTWRCRVIAPPG